MHPDDTIAAVATAAGPGLRAVIRLAGPNTRTVLTALLPDLPVGRSVRPKVLLAVPGLHSPVPADVYLWAAPQSYTGQDSAELHLVSSPPIVELVMAALLANGARVAGPGEFTQRAFLAGKKDLTQAEAVLAVIEANTDADLTIALDQLAGGVAKPLATLRSDLLDLLADVEAALDFADEDIEFVSANATLTRIAAGLGHLKNLSRQVADRSVSGRAVRVALVGPPNAGKSTLFNALVGRPAALVSPIPGTTRDYLTAELTLAGVPVELIDTAGLGLAQDAIDADSQTLGQTAANRADVTIVCVPLTILLATPNPESAPGPKVRAATHADLSTHAAPPGWIHTSAVNVNGLTELLEALSVTVASVVAPPLAPSQARCRAHLATATQALTRAHEHARESDPPELLALALREALHEIGTLAGTIYTNDLLDRIFSRFCIGK